MPTLVVVGVQWGDEGKGKVVHLLGQKADLIIRYQGGNNAGHTVIFDGKHFVLHLVPSGILQPHKICVIANGVVVDPAALQEEVELLERQKVRIKDRLYISDAAHMILPYHRLLDGLREDRKGGVKIGTTRKGIGPAYSDKVGRSGIRIADFLEPETFKELLERNLHDKAPLLKKFGSVDALKRSILKDAPAQRRFLEPLVVNASVLVNEWIRKKKWVLMESAQGALLDVDFGTYPYVTSSNPIAGGACIGAGVGPNRIDEVLGIVKAYTTRVGEGPFPTELKDSAGETLRKIGMEFGATTGRPRRCGWFDSVVVRHAVRINGAGWLALTKLDVLSGMPHLKICVAYRLNGRITRDFPTSRIAQKKVVPIYETLPGFSGNIRGVTKFGQLPKNAQTYVRRLEQLSSARIALISLGRSREETIMIDKRFPWA